LLKLWLLLRETDSTVGTVVILSEAKDLLVANEAEPSRSFASLRMTIWLI
jgi:hypothetical protein